MRVLGVSLLSGLALVALPVAAKLQERPRPAPPAQQIAQLPAKDNGGLCRRAVALPPVPPEAPVELQQRTSRTRADVAPPPPAPPPPPPVPVPPPIASPVVTATPEEAPPAMAVAPAPESAMSAAPVVSEPPVMREPGSAFSPRAPRQPQPQSGLLTAGDHDDLLNPELYARYVDEFLAGESLQGVPRVDTARVLTVAVRDGAGRPVPFARVTLTCADGNALILATLADGTAAFFPALDRLGSEVRMTVAGPNGAAAGARRIAIDGSPGQQLQTVTLGSGTSPVRKFDLAVVIDTTGSMTDELEYLKAELRSILDDLSRRHAGLDIRLALIPYRDEGDIYVTRTFPFTAWLETIQAHLRAESADGGGDTPEAMEQAMARAVSLDWRPDAVKSLLLVADAPPHADDVARTWQAAEVARARRIQIVPVAASGVDRGAEYIMRAMAAATQSRYVFLTDDSGVGNPHAPPAIDCYLVTRLDAMLRRVLDGQISGRRVEPNEGEVLRAVGRYEGGRCVLPPDFDRQQRQQ